MNRPPTDPGGDHEGCFVCGMSNKKGLGLCFRSCADGSVESLFLPSREYEGYSLVLHGGITAMLLDAAMTHCLFARGIQAVTASLEVRYVKPISAEQPVALRARHERSLAGIHVLAAELRQNGQIRATAAGRFAVKKFAGASVRKEAAHEVLSRSH